MKINHRFKILTASLFATFILVGFTLVFCQENQNLNKNAQEKGLALTAGQTLKIKKILSGYHASELTAADAKSIQDQFREAGIHSGPENNSAIKAAGFDPEKLRQFAPPPNADKMDKNVPRGVDQRMQVVVEKICKPLALSVEQQQVVAKAFSDFYVEMDKLRQTEPDRQAPLDKSKVDPLEKTRDLQIKKVITDAQFTKYLELEKAARPARPNGEKPR